MFVIKNNQSVVLETYHNILQRDFFHSTCFTPQTVWCVDLRTLLIFLIFFWKIQEVRHHLGAQKKSQTRKYYFSIIISHFTHCSKYMSVVMCADLWVAHAGCSCQGLLHSLVFACRLLAAAGSAAPVCISQQMAQNLNMATLGSVH